MSLQRFVSSSAFLLAVVSPRILYAQANDHDSAAVFEATEVNGSLLGAPSNPPTTVSSWHEARRMIVERLPAIEERRALARQTRAQVDVEVSKALPHLVGLGGITRQLVTGTGHSFTAQGEQLNTTIPDPVTAWTAGLSFSAPLFAPASWARLRAGRSSAEAADLDRRAAEQLALRRAGEAMFDLYLAQGLARVSRQSVRAALQAQVLMDHSKTVGQVTELDVSRVGEEAAVALTELAVADEAVRAAREALGAALGLVEPCGISEALPLEAFLAELRQSCAGAEVEQMLEVAAAGANKEAATKAANAVSYDWLPEVDAVSNVTYLSSEKLSPNGKQVTWTVGGVLSWTLFDGGLRRAEAASADAATSVAAAKLGDARRLAVLERVSAARQVELARSQVAAATSAAEFSRRTISLTHLAFVNGGATAFDIVDATRHAREAEVNLVRATTQQFHAIGQLLLSSSVCQID